MNTQTELKNIQSLLLEQISSAASNRDVAKVAELSGLAKECERIETEWTLLNRRVQAIKISLNGSRSKSTVSAKPTYSTRSTPLSGREVGKQVRLEWIGRLTTHGISLNRYGKKYQTMSGLSVGVAFANELARSKNKWFLGLPDEPTDIIVLLCKPLAGNLHDIVLPASDLPEGWSVLSRSHTGVKFNVKRDAARFLMYVSGKDMLDVTRYIGNYNPLR